MAGTVQVFLLVGGVKFWTGYLLHDLPGASYWHVVAKGIGVFVFMLSLLWPLYVFGMAKRSFEDNANVGDR